MKNSIWAVALVLASLFASAKQSNAQAVYALTTPRNPVSPGQVLEFDLSASDLETQSINDVELSFTVPQYTTYNGNAAGTAENISFLGSARSPGGTQVTQIYFTVLAGTQAPPEGATITLKLTDENSVSISRSVVVHAKPKLNLQLSTDEDAVPPAGEFTYAFSYFTPGLVNLAGATLSVPVPPGSSFVSADHGGTLAKGVVTWPLGTVVSGSNGQVHLTLKADAVDQDGQFLLVEPTMKDAAGDLAGASDTRTIYTPPSVSYSLTAPTDPVSPGQVLEFDVSASDLETQSINDVDLSFTVPQYTTYNGNPAGTAEYTSFLGNARSPGGTQVVQLYFTVLAGTQAPPEGATITLNLIDGNGASISRSVVVHAKHVLNLQLSTDQSTVLPSGAFTYEFSYFTPDIVNVPAAILSVPVPLGSNFVSADHGGTVANRVVTWPLGTVVSGSNGQVHLTLQADADQDGEFLLVEAAMTDAAGDLTRASDSRTVSASPPVGYALTAPVDPVSPGQVLEFDLSESDLGTQGISDQDLSFTVPQYTTYNGNAAGTAESVGVGGNVRSPGGTGVVPIYFTVLAGTQAPPEGATITLNLFDGNGASISRSVVVHAKPKLDLQLSTAQSNATQGANFIYTLSCFTSGTSNLAGGELSVPVPVGTIFSSASVGGVLKSGVVSWPLGTIVSGSSTQMHLTLLTRLSAQNGQSLPIEGTLSDSAGDEARSSDTRIVNGSPLATYTLTRSVVSAAPGQTVSFTLKATNVGASSYSPSVTFTIPQYAVYASNGDAAGTNETINFSELSPEQASAMLITLRFSATAPAGAPITLNVIDPNGASVSNTITIKAK